MNVVRTGGAAVGQAKRHAERAAREVAPWVERLARLGHAAKGVVYGIIGLLALQAAMGAGGRATDAQGALVTILRQPFGQVLLGIVALGLVGYALWRFVEAFLDPEGRGSDAKGIAKRIGYFISGVAYGGLAFTAAQMLMGTGAQGGGDTTQDWTARFLAQPAGAWLVGAAGVVIIGIGLNALYVAWTAKFRKKLKLGEMSPTEETWATHVGRLGYAARGVVFGLIGAFLIHAALEANPNEAHGLAGTLKILARQPYGPWLLGAVAAGLIAYGIWMFVAARYRRIAPV